MPGNLERCICVLNLILKVWQIQHGLTVRKKEEEELPWGGTLSFYWCIVGGSIDAKYINAIKKGIMQKMEEGPLTGSYCQNIRVCIYDGKMHPVDSNDMAFMLAASAAFKTCLQRCRTTIVRTDL